MSNSSLGEFALYLFVLVLILLIWAAWAFFSTADLGGGFDPGDSWLEWIAWAFRSISLLTGLLVAAILPIWAWKNDHRNLYIETYGISQSEPPSDLSAAAVTVLEEREATAQTVMTILFEMCQSGVLRLTFELKDDEYEAKLSSGRRSKLDWENTVCEAIERNDFEPHSEQFRKAVGRQLGVYLQNRGLFDSNPTSVAWWLPTLCATGTVLFAGALIAWMVFADANLFAEVVIVIALVPIYIFLFFLYYEIAERASKRAPTRKGLQEMAQWMAFSRHLRRMKAPEEGEKQVTPYPFSSYAIALDADEGWMFSGIADSLGIRTKGAHAEADLDSMFMGWLSTLHIHGRLLEEYIRSHGNLG